jgi:hypothetical protein
MFMRYSSSTDAAIAGSRRRIKRLFGMFTMRALSIAGAICLAVSAAASAQQAWLMVESKPPKNDSDQLSAVMVVGDAALILRCRNQTTEAAFSTKDTYLGDQFVIVRYRINSENPVKEVWRASMDGRAAFASNPMNFIRILPDNGRVFIRAIAADGQNKDTNFKLSDVSEVRDKIGHACNWSSVPDESTGTINQPEAR